MVRIRIRNAVYSLAFIQTFLWVASPSNGADTRRKTPKAKPKNEIIESNDQLLATSLFVDFVGPIQYQTFAQSNETGELKFDPNLVSYGISGGYWQNLTGFALETSALVRTAKSFDNGSQVHHDGSSETLQRSTKVSMMGFGTRFSLAPELHTDRVWLPQVGLAVEYSSIKVDRAQDGGSFQQAQDFSVQSTKLFSYIEVASNWLVDLYGVPGLIGIKFYVPLRSWTLSHAKADDELTVLDQLQHKSALGLGASIGGGIWL